MVPPQTRIPVDRGEGEPAGLAGAALAGDQAEHLAPTQGLVQRRVQLGLPVLREGEAWVEASIEGVELPEEGLDGRRVMPARAAEHPARILGRRRHGELHSRSHVQV